MKKQPAYTYSRFRGTWRVWEMTYYENGSSGAGVADYGTREEARQETYRLNGWKWKEKEASPITPLQKRGG